MGSLCPTFQTWPCSLFNVQCSLFMPHCKAFNFGFVFHNNLNGSSGNHTGLSVKNISSNKSIKNLECYPAVLGWLFKFSEQLTAPTLKCYLETSWSMYISKLTSSSCDKGDPVFNSYVLNTWDNKLLLLLHQRVKPDASYLLHLSALISTSPSDFLAQIIALIWPTSFLSLRMLAISMIWHKYVLFHDFQILLMCY